MNDLVDSRFRFPAMTWSRWFGQLEGLVKVYSDCDRTPSSSSAPALTGGCHGWHEAGSYPVIDDDALWNCGNLAAGAQAWAAVLAREISNGLWAPASPPSGFSATVSGRPQAGQVHSGVGHGARSAHALTASSFSMNWNGAGAGQRPATWSGSPERSRTWSRWTPVGKSRPASSLASHARRRLPRSSRRRSWPRCPP